MRRLPFPPRLLILSTTLALIAAVAVYVLLAPSSGGDDTTQDQIQLEKDPTAGVAYTTFTGDEVAIGAHRGTPLVVNFFSKDCIPCITEMPALEQVHQALGDQVKFLGLAVEDRGADAQAFVKSTGVTYDTARDPDGQVIHALGGQALLPTTVLIDADGAVVRQHRGVVTAEELTKLLHDDLGIDVSAPTTTAP